MATPIRVLLIEDSEDAASLLVRALRQGGFEVASQRVDSAATLKQNLYSAPWDIVIADYSMPGFSGAAALQIVRSIDPDIPFFFVSGTIGEETAVQAMRQGANDYIMKGSLARLIPAIQRELREAEVRREHKRIERRMTQLEKFEIIGKLAGGVAHDFNNVIGAILGWADLGLAEVPRDSRAANFFRQIRG